MFRNVAASLAICAGCASTAPSRAEPGAAPTPSGSATSTTTTNDPPAPHTRGPRCPALRELADCLHAAVSELQDEPREGELPSFVARARDRGVVACETADADVRWSRREGSWDHHDDTTTVVHIIYRFDATGCASEEVGIELQMGGPPS